MMHWCTLCSSSGIRLIYLGADAGSVMGSERCPKCKGRGQYDDEELVTVKIKYVVDKAYNANN